MPKIYKVLIDEETYLGLKAESLLCNKTIKDTISFLVSSHLSPDALKVLNVLKDKRTLMPDGQKLNVLKDIEIPESHQSSPSEDPMEKSTRPWHGGPTPYEDQYPDIAARVLELWAGGKRAGGLSRDAVAKVMQAEGVSISAAQVDKITIRARKKNI